MHSTSKTALSAATAQAIVHAHLGANLTLEAFDELKEGYFNAAYYLKLSDLRAYVLKVAPSDAVRVLRYERGIMRAEVEVMRLVRAQTSMPVPEIYAYDTSRQHLPGDYYIMAFVPGTPLHKIREQLASEESQTIDRKLGGFLREMNAIQGSAFGYYVSPNYATWRAAFAAMLDGVLADGRDIGAELPCPYDALSQGLAGYFDVLDEITRPHLVHWDLWDGNIFFDETARQITGVIDFERSLWGDPLMEVNFRGLDEANAFGEGYGRTMLDTPARQVHRRLYNIYLYLIMVIEHHYRNYDSWDLTNWARAQLVSELQALNLLA